MTLRIERSGQGEPLVLLHGLGGDRTTWAPIREELAAEREVVVVELPGFGASDPLPGDVEPSPAALARAVGAALTDRERASAHVAGVSLGGWVALELAEQGVGRGVTALCPAGFWDRALGETRGGAHRAAKRWDRFLPLLMRSRRLRRGVLGGTLGGPARFTPEQAVQILRGYGRATDFHRVNGEMRTRTYGGGPRLGALARRVPVDVAWATEDRLVVPPKAPLPANVGVHVLEGCGHLPMYDDPEATAALLLRTSAASSTTAPASPTPPAERDAAPAEVSR